MGPSIAGFISFVQNVMGISNAVLPTTSIAITYAYNVALEIVNQTLCAVPGSSNAVPTLYALAVYNLAGDNLLNYAPDLPGAQTFGQWNGKDLPFFAYMRASLNLGGFVGGVIQSANDATTGESMVVPDAMKGFTMANLQMLKTPYGRQYMAIAQSYGPSVWGLT